VEFFQNPTGSRNGSVGIKVGNGVSTFNQLPHIVSDEESDPVFTNHPAYQITQDLIDSWNDDAEGISDAPNSKAYSRQKGVWVEAPTLNQVKDLEAKVEAGGGGSSYDDTQIKADLATETQARTDADAGLQTQIDNLDLSGEDYDDTQIKADLATETQARIDGDAALDLRIDAVEDSITDGGGFVDAPNDGKLYGRQSENWTEVPDGGVSDWADIENKPTEFPPEDHTHEIADIDGLQDALDNAGTSYAVAIADTPPENGKSGDTWFNSTEGEGALYIHDGDVWFSSNNSGSGAGIEDAPEDGVQYSRQDGSWSAVDAYDDSQISSDLSKEIQDRETGDAALQDQIDQLGSGGGGWELLATVKAASSSNVELSQLTDEFDDYKIIVSDVVGSTNAAFRMQVAINGSYKTIGYGFYCNFSHTGNNAFTGQSSNNDSYFSLFQDLVPANTTLNSIEISAFGANNSTGSKTFFWHGMSYYNYGYLSIGGGYQTDVGKLTGIRFLMSNGKVAKGTFRLYGIKK
jgi:hypothetical protein